MKTMIVHGDGETVMSERKRCKHTLMVKLSLCSQMENEFRGGTLTVIDSQAGGNVTEVRKHLSAAGEDAIAP